MYSCDRSLGTEQPVLWDATNALHQARVSCAKALPIEEGFRAPLEVGLSTRASINASPNRLRQHKVAHDVREIHMQDSYM